MHHSPRGTLTRGSWRSALKPPLWIRLFATKAVNTKNREDRQTNRQTMYRDYRSENREKKQLQTRYSNTGKLTENKLRLRVCLGPSMEKFLLAPKNYGNISATRPASYNVHTGAMLQQQFTYFKTTIAKKNNYRPVGGETICPRRWQFGSRRIYVRPRTSPQSAHG